MEKLAAILEKSLKRLDLAPRLNEYRVWPIWDETVGPLIAQNAQPEKIRHGTLFVKVSGPTWMQQLQYMKEMITEKLNQRLGEEVVKNLFFIIGKVQPQPPTTKAKIATAHRSCQPVSELDQRALDAIRDPGIRQSFKRLMDAHSQKRRP